MVLRKHAFLYCLRLSSHLHNTDKSWPSGILLMLYIPDVPGDSRNGIIWNLSRKKIYDPATFFLGFQIFPEQSIWAASSEFGTYRLCEQRRFRQACASAQSRQNLRCSLIQEVSQEEPSDRKPDPWPLWMAGHAQLKFVMTECSKTQIRLTRPIWFPWCPLLLPYTRYPQH